MALDAAEAVRQALEQLGEAAKPEEIAAHVEKEYGLTLRPSIVKIVLAALLEKGVVERSRKLAHQRLEEHRATEQATAKKPRKRRKAEEGA